MAPARRIYLDANILIHAKEGADGRSDTLLELMEVSARWPLPLLVTSELTLAEIVVAPLRRRTQGLVAVYDQWLVSSDWLSVVPVGRDVLWNAGRLRADYPSLKLPDAVHLATALSFGCHDFLSGDTRLKGDYALGVADERPLAIIRPDVDSLAKLLVDVAP